MNPALALSRNDEEPGVPAMIRTVRERIPFYRDHLAGDGFSNFSCLPSFNKARTVGYGRFPLSSGALPARIAWSLPRAPPAIASIFLSTSGSGIALGVGWRRSADEWASPTRMCC